MDLRLAYNPGVASAWARVRPAGVITALTAAIIVAVAVALWRAARRGWGMAVAGLSAVMGGASANLVDRASDGVVTD